MYPPILFLCRKGIQFNALIEVCAKNYIPTISSDTLNEFINIVHSKKIIMTVIEDSYLKKQIENHTSIYQRYPLSFIDIKVVIGKKSEMQQLNSKFDYIIQEKASLLHKFDDIIINWEESKKISELKNVINY